MFEIFDQYRRSEKMVHRNVEIALNLRRMQIERERSAGARGFEQVSDQLGGYRNARLIFAILPRIAVIRQHRGDSPGGSAFKGINHEQKFEQVVVHRIMAGLDDKYVSAAHILQNLKIYFAIAEPAEHGLAQRNIQMLADGARQHGVRSSGKNFEALVVQKAISALQNLQVEISWEFQGLRVCLTNP